MIFVHLKDRFICTQRKDYQYHFTQCVHFDLEEWGEPLSNNGYTSIGPTILAEWTE